MPGGPEIMVILLVALLILGPEQLPKAMRTFGNAMAEIRKVSGGFQAEMRKAMDEIDPRTEDKPHSPKPPSGQPGEITTTATENGDTEVIARNPATPDVLAAETRPELPDDAVTDGAEVSPAASGERPAVDPAERAAG